MKLLRGWKTNTLPEALVNGVLDGFTIFGLLVIITLWVLVLTGHQACAHDQWANGSSIPSWVKESCCGPADAHHLMPEQVHDMGDHYTVDGFPLPIPKSYAGVPNNEIIPSQDGDYWIFYKGAGGIECAPEAPGTACHPVEPQIYCFFVPLAI